MASVYADLCRYGDAEGLYERAVAIREKHEREHPDYFGISLDNLAGLYMDEGRYGDAEPLFKRAQSILEQALGPKDPELATSFDNLAGLYHAVGQYGAAEQFYIRALQIRQDTLEPSHPDIARSLNNLAGLYHRQRRYEKAEPLYQRAIAIEELNPQRPDDLAKSLDNLASLYADVGQFTKAGQLHERALDIEVKIFGTKHPEVAASLHNLGAMYYMQGQYAEAEHSYNLALQIRGSTLGPDYPSTGRTLENLAILYYGWGRPLEAQTFFDRTFGNLAGQFEQLFPYMSERDRLEFLQTVSYVFGFYFSFSASYKQRMPDLAGNVYDLLLFEKGMVAESVGAQRARVVAGGDPEALNLLNRLSAKRNQYAALTRVHPESRESLNQLSQETNALEKQLAQRSTTFVEHEKLIRASWRDVQKSLKAEEAALEFVRFPFYDGKHWADKSLYVALVLRPASVLPQWVPLGETKDLEGAPMEDYRQRVAMGPPSGDDVGVRFYRAFWKPLEPSLVGATRIYLSPDGLLNTVSWAAVPMEDGRLLIEKYDVRVVLSTKDLLRQPHHSSNLSAVLMGNPKFDLSEAEQRAAVAALQTKRAPQTLLAQEKQLPSTKQTSTNESTTATANVARGLRSRDEEKGALPALGKTQKEIESVGGLLEKQHWQVASYSQQEALEEVVKGIKGPRVLHVATHGFFEPDQKQEHREMMSDQPSGLEDPMLRSGLYFAGANRVRSGQAPVADLEDGELTAYEATGLNLQGTELVVLSACETGLGEVQNGEGVFGLRRALQEAGAEAVLMSMWSVPDKETQELMAKFYEGWLAGKDKQEALREAQLQLRTEVKARRGDDRPYYWAAFVLVGR